MRLCRKAIIAAVSAAIVGATVPGALAADDTNVTVTGGSLSITNPTAADFTGVTLDGTAKTTYATFDNFSATDARGTGAGWNVTVQATQFAEHDGAAYVGGGKTLPQDSLQLAELTVALGDPTSSAAPSITAGPYTIDGVGAIKVASAAADGTGMGSYDFTQGDLDGGTGGSQPLRLSVPASAYARTYRSDVTVTVATGP